MNLHPILNTLTTTPDEVMDIITLRPESWTPVIILTSETNLIDHASKVERKAIVLHADGNMILIQPADSLNSSKTLHRVDPDSPAYSTCRQAVGKQSPNSYPLINWRG